MAAEHRTLLAGEPVALLADRALYWPACKRLLIADLHLGKADVFRRAGIGLPAGGTHHDLERLDALLLNTGARELWILGDILHGPAHRSPWHATWNAWRRERPDLRVVGLAGNHDRALQGAELEMEHAGVDFGDSPFLLRHDPIPHPGLHVICGHLHPLASLPGLRRRWPAFWLRPGLTILPAFSHFTAGVVAAPARGEQLVACVEGAAIPLPVHS